MNYYQEIIKCLESIGVIILEDCDDVDLTEYQIDSLMFVSLIVELESHFHIEISDNYLTYQTIASLKGLSNLIETLCNDSEEE